MSAIPHPLPLLRPTAATVLASLHARKTGLALALGKDAPEPARAPSDVFDALWIPGAVVELSALPGAGALTLALLLLADARRRALALGRPAYLCAVDPSRTLHAPAVASLLAPRGVTLDKLVVLQPDSSRLLRTSVRALRSGAFAGLFVDAGGESDLSSLVTGVRRLTLAAEESQTFGVLLTSTRSRRGLPLPVAARALVESVDGDIHVTFLRHRFGNLPKLILAR